MSISTSQAFSKGTGTSGGLTLIEVPSARSAAVAEAYTAVSNDISAFSYNPASLKSLKSGQASFLYQKGLAEDAFGQFMIGAPMKKGSMGLSIGYYNGGDIDLYLSDTDQRTVNAQTDLAVSLGYAHSIGGIMVGGAAKYLSSELIESEKAQAFAADLGVSFPVHSRVNFGAAIQNIGTQLKYVEVGDNLPRIARMGLAVDLLEKRSMKLLTDVPYYLNEQEFQPSIGLEYGFGMLAIRAGYKLNSDQEEFTAGAGFMLGTASLDYAFGLMDQFDSRHRISLSMRFGQGAAVSAPIARSKPVQMKTAKPSAPPASKVQNRNSLGTMNQAAPVKETTFVEKKIRRIYVVRPGDTLKSISKEMYGTTENWRLIYSANKHLIENPAKIEVGQKIILP